MAATKSVTVLQDNLFVADGGRATSAATSLTTSFGATLYHRVSLTGAANLTTATSSLIEVSPDNANWYNFTDFLVSSTGAGKVDEWVVDLPVGIQYIRVDVTGNVGDSIQIRTDIVNVSDIS